MVEREAEASLSHLRQCQTETVILLLGLLAGLGSATLAAKQMITTNPVQDKGVLVVDASSPAFAIEVQKLLTPEAIAKASSFLPQSLIVINNTDQYIWGFTVVYRYPEWIAPAGTPWKHRISPSAGGAGERNRMLPPGGHFLVTPVSDFLASATSSGSRILQPYLDEGMDRMISHFNVQHPESNERVEVVLDSVIFENGILAGPDSEGMLERVNERIRAEKDLALSIGKLKGEDLKKKLLLHSGKGAGDEYSARTSAIANSLLGVLDKHGEAAVGDIAEKMRTTKWFANSETVRRK